MRIQSFTILAVIAVIAAVAAGCTSRQAAQSTADAFAATPKDFSLSAEVFAPVEAGVATVSVVDDGESAAQPVELRPIRFVVFPDGSLHAGSPPVGALDRLPPFVRRLNQMQYAALWSRLRQLGLIQPENRESFVGRGDANIASAPLTYHVEVAANGERWSYTRQSDAATPPDPAVAELVRELAELAWVSELLEPEVRIAPRRYDFGPDPYARYRESGGDERSTSTKANANGS